jgi:hypothetical protein
LGIANAVPGSIVGKGDFNSLRLVNGFTNREGLPKQYVQLGTLAQRSMVVNTVQLVTLTWQRKDNHKTTKQQNNKTTKQQRTQNKQNTPVRKNLQPSPTENQKPFCAPRTLMGIKTGNTFALGPP